MANWELTHTSSATTKTLAAWGFTAAKRTRKSMAADVLELEHVPDDFTDATEPESASWEYGDHVSITKDSSPWFEGTLSPATRSATPDQFINWQVLGPWQDLETIQYFQLYGSAYEDAGTDPPTRKIKYVERGDVTLMQRLDQNSGIVTPIRTGDQILDLLEFARTRSATASYDIGSIMGGFLTGYVEARDETVAQLVRTLAKWHPRAVVWFDYDVSPPTINFTETGAPTMTIDYAAFADETAISLGSQEDLQVPYVKICYKAVDSIDVGGVSQSVVNPTYDVYPPGADNGAEHKRALRATIDTAGSSRTIQQQKVRTRPLPGSSDGASVNPESPPKPIDGHTPGSGNQWKAAVRRFLAQDDRLPWLRDIVQNGNPDDNNIGVVSFTVEKSVPTDTDKPPKFDENGNLVPAAPVEDDYTLEEEEDYELWELPRVLSEGTTTADWMGVKTRQVKVTAKLIFKGAARKGRNIKARFTKHSKDPADPTFWRPAWEGSFTVTATDAVSKTYKRTTAATAAEEIPQGIAERLYNDLSVLRHTGSITLTADDIGDAMDWRPGQLVNITNSNNPDWTAMNVIVQQVSEDIATGITTVAVGAPDQLGINDFVTLARLWQRNPQSFTDDKQRGEGNAAPAGSEIPGGEQIQKDFNDAFGAPRNAFVVHLDAVDPPATGFDLLQDPGWIDTSRDPNGVGVPPIMVKMGSPAKDLDDDKPPTLSMPAGEVRKLYHEATFDGDGYLSDVTAKLTGAGQDVPASDDAIDGTETREIAVIDTTVTPYVIEQIVEGSYTWAGKPMQNTASGIYYPQFYPLAVTGERFTRFQLGYVEAELEAGNEKQDPDEMYKIFTVKVQQAAPGNKKFLMDDPRAQLPVAIGAMNYYWLETTYVTEVSHFDSTVDARLGKGDWTAAGDYPQQLNFRLEDGVNPVITHTVNAAHPTDSLTFKNRLVATIDARVNPYVKTSIPQGAVNMIRPMIWGHGGTSDTYVPLT